MSNTLESNKNIKLIEQIREVILNDYSVIMHSNGATIGKFILIAVGIEFLGACLDKQHMKATARGEKRFNLALTKLFPKKYHHFTKLGAVPNLYNDFRCSILHQLKPEKSLILFSRNEAGENRHLTYNQQGALIIVAEDFYQDLQSAAYEMIKMLEKQV